jgi:ribosome maturation factor RimP
MDLESVDVTPAGRRRRLKVVVDADGGVGLDEMAEVSRALSAELDASGAMGDAPYTLEVSSPGVNRPLTEPRHWRRAAGRLVSVPLTADGPEGETDRSADGALRGRVITASENGVVLDIDGEHRTFGYDEVGTGRIELEFGRGDRGERDGH